MKIIEITNVDFSLRHFLLPLMRALRARGHDVVGVCAEGPLLDDVRAEGFRVVAAPFARRVSPLAHWRAFRALVALFRAEQPDLVHAHMPISGFLARLAAWRAGVPRVAFTCHGFLFNNREGAWPQRAASFAMEWLGGRVTDVYLTVSTEEAADARRLGIARHAVAVGNGRDPAVFRPDPAARARLRGELGTPEDRVVVVAVSRLVAHKGFPRAGRRHARRAERGTVGRRRAAGLRPRRRHGGDAARRRPGRPAAAAGLSRRCGRGAGGGRHLRAAELFRGPADVGDRGDADRTAGRRHRRSAVRASKWCRK